MKSTRKAALFYASKGWPVFPVWPMRGERCACGNDDCIKNAGKHPVTYLRNTPIAPNGVTDATTDTDQINSWWDMLPDANIGARGERWFALDVDDLDALYELRESYDELPHTVTSISGSGGYHILFSQPNPPLGNGEGDLPIGINVRGIGGYIILPPSMHQSGKRYEWELSSHPRDTEVADPPDWLVRLLEVNGGAETPEVEFQNVDSDIPTLSQWKISSKIHNLITAEPTGDRSRKDQVVITALVGAGATDDEIRAVFQHYPIGRRGKYADKGSQADRYLAHSIGKARLWVEQHPYREPEPSELVPEVSLTPAQKEREQKAIERIRQEEYWRGYHDALTETERAMWHKQGVDDTLIDWFALGYAEERTNTETGEIVEGNALTVPFKDPGGEVVNIEYWTGGGNIQYESEVTPPLFIAEWYEDSTPVLIAGDSLDTMNVWAKYGQVEPSFIGGSRLNFVGLPHIPLLPQSIRPLEKTDQIYVLMEPGTMNGRGLGMLKKRARFVALPVTIDKLLRMVDMRGFERMLRHAKVIA